MRRRPLLPIVLSCLVWAACDSPAAPAVPDNPPIAYAPPTGLRGQIAFVSDRDGNAEIYVIDADGSGLQRLTANRGVDDGPAWSPDGSRIAFVSDRGGTPDIYVMAPDGTNIVRLGADLPLYGTELAWSPGGSAMAFETMHYGSSSIATVGTVDGAVAFLTDGPGFNGQPSWSPDGGQLAFVSDRDAYDYVFNIYTMNADGSDPTLRTDGFGFWPNVPYYFHPTWSPDGGTIAFVYGTVISRSDMRFRVAVMSVDGRFAKDLAWAGDIGWSGLLDPGSLAWSPDGRGVAYTFVDCDMYSGVTCSNVRSVNYVSVDGREQGILVSNAYGPSWRR